MNENLNKLLKGKRHLLLEMGIAPATAGRLLYFPNVNPKTKMLRRIRANLKVSFGGPLSGKELLSLMKSRNISIRELARRSGVEKNTISSYTRTPPKMDITYNSLIRLVNALPDEPIPNRGLTDEDRNVIREMRRIGSSLVDIASVFGVSESAISRIASQK